MRLSVCVVPASGPTDSSSVDAYNNAEADSENGHHALIGQLVKSHPEPMRLLHERPGQQHATSDFSADHWTTALMQAYSSCRAEWETFSVVQPLLPLFSVLTTRLGDK